MSTILIRPGLFLAAAALTVAVSGGCAAAPEAALFTKNAPAAYTVTTVDTSFSAVLSSPCDAVPPSLTGPDTAVTAREATGPLLGTPAQPACTTEWTPGITRGWTTVLYRDLAPRRKLRAQQPTAQAFALQDLDVVQFPVPTDDPTWGTTCVIVADLGPDHGIAFIAADTAPSHIATTCTTAQHGLLAVFHHLRTRPR